MHGHVREEKEKSVRQASDPQGFIRMDPLRVWRNASRSVVGHANLTPTITQYCGATAIYDLDGDGSLPRLARLFSEEREHVVLPLTQRAGLAEAARRDLTEGGEERPVTQSVDAVRASIPLL
jgi:hypothetical protein